MTDADDLGRDPAEGAPESAATRSASAPRRPRRRGSRALRIFGVLLLVAGLSCLGWVGYQYFGTNLVSSHRFTTERQALKQKWQAASTPTVNRNTSDPRLKEPMAVPGDAIALLRIPAFGEDFEVPVLSGTDLNILSSGVGHYAGTANPGQVGNFAIAGHRITHGQPFSQLLQLKQGDHVVVETRDAIFIYVLDMSPADLTVDESATWVLDPVPNHPDQQPTTAMITLTTCQDLFRSSDRSIGFGHLESAKVKG